MTANLSSPTDTVTVRGIQLSMVDTREQLKILSQIRRGERVEHFETVRLKKDGTRIDISLTISPVKDAMDDVVGASKIARDITKRKD